MLDSIINSLTTYINKKAKNDIIEGYMRIAVLFGCLTLVSVLTFKIYQL